MVLSKTLQHCDIIRKAAEAGGLLMDAMVSIQEDGLKNHSTSVSLMIAENGSGGPCIDLRQVSSELAAVAKDSDLVWQFKFPFKHTFPRYMLSTTNACTSELALNVMQIILEGMGRAIHTNLDAHFKCDALKVRVFDGV